MAFVSWSGILRVLKPVVAGMGMAFVATALLDGPPPVNFQPENPFSAKQAEIVEPQAELVIEKNIMKLGSLLSVQADEPGSGQVIGPVGGDLGQIFDIGPGAETAPQVRDEAGE